MWLVERAPKRLQTSTLSGFTTWLVGLGSQPPKRPQTSTILDLLSKEVENWGKTIVPPPVVESTVRVASRVEDDSGFFRLNQFCGTN